MVERNTLKKCATLMRSFHIFQKPSPPLRIHGANTCALLWENQRGGYVTGIDEVSKILRGNVIRYLNSCLRETMTKNVGKHAYP